MLIVLNRLWPGLDVTVIDAALYYLPAMRSLGSTSHALLERYDFIVTGFLELPFDYGSLDQLKIRAGPANTSAINAKCGLNAQCKAVGIV